jgi:hypothetical protein
MVKKGVIETNGPVVQRLRIRVPGKDELAGWLAVPPNPKARDADAAPAEGQLIRVREIFEGEAGGYRQALANVYATLDAGSSVRLVYMIEGGPEGIELYFGVVTTASAKSALHEGTKLLLGALEGQLAGLSLERETPEQSRQLLQRAVAAPVRGLLLGVPSTQQQEDEGPGDDFQGVERLARALLVGSEGRSGDRWHMLIVSRPLARSVVPALLEDALAVSTEVSLHATRQLQFATQHGTQKASSRAVSANEGSSRSDTYQRGKSEGASTAKTDQRTDSWGGGYQSESTSNARTKQVGTNESRATTVGTQEGTSVTDTSNFTATEGGSLNVSAQLVDKKLELLREHLEEQLIPRLRQGYARGLMETSVLLSAQTPSAYRRLANTLAALHQGPDATMSPLRVIDVPKEVKLSPLLDDWPMPLPTWYRLVHSLTPVGHAPASLLTVDELAILAGLPRREIPGIARRATASFALALPRVDADQAVRLGCLIDHGRRLLDLPLTLRRGDFNKHVFVTGVTGAGKTTTCIKLLLESGLAFLVIEPAKTEYRALAAYRNDIVLYRPLADPHGGFRLNPLAMVHGGQRLMSHVEFVSSALTAVFPMEASMPFLVKQAIVAAYQQRGWDVASGLWMGGEDPFDPAQRAWPTLSEMIRQLDDVIKAQRMGQEFEQKYRGSLVSRLSDLTRGPLGAVLDVRQSIDFDALLDRRAVLELEEVKSPQGKALLMALVLGALSEAVKARHLRDPDFRHLTLVEEAHRLLSRPEPGSDDGRKLAVDAFADMLAEVRKYGEGLVVVDQIPAKLIPDVLKNTHTKIVHRLFAADDRQTLADAMMMDEAQRDFLPKLGTGEVVVYCGGWHQPALGSVEEPRMADPRPIGMDALALEDSDVRQFWASRGRYSPHLCSVGIFSESSGRPVDDLARDHAEFTLSARRALTAWLQLNPCDTPHAPGKAGAAAWARSLSGFQRRWAPLAEREQAGYDQRRRLPPFNDRGPRSIVACALLAVACDSNPLVRVEVEGAIELGLRFDSEVWAGAFDMLSWQMRLLSEGRLSTLQAQGIPSPSAWSPEDWALVEGHWRCVCADYLVQLERF